ncbi:MAG: hypothetical protein HPY50_21095 [Firmicutes bacterium]|nr:hypothetical protein [Bacillota bacterium]
MEVITERFYEPSSTSPLNDLPEEIFEDLETSLAFITGLPVEISIVKQNDKWLLYSRSREIKQTGVRAGCFVFNFEFILPAIPGDSCAYDASPQVKISNLTIAPRRKGLGTKVVRRFLLLIRNTPFTRIVLNARDSAAASFWQSLGFDYVSPNRDLRPEMPSMFLSLKPGAVL